jgi:Arc/MetJ family transcription regulator
MQQRTTIRIDEELLKACQHRCIDEGITFTEMVERALRDYLKNPLDKGQKGGRR